MKNGIIGTSFEEYDVAAAAFDEWLELAFATPAEDWAACESYAPTETMIRSHSGQARLLELEFRPVAQLGKVTQIMLLASDVSAARALENALRSARSAWPPCAA